MPHATASRAISSFTAPPPQLFIPTNSGKRDLTFVSSPPPSQKRPLRKFKKLSCHFLQLPREIRDLIYKFVFPGALVAIGNFRVWVPEGKPYMIGTCLEPSGQTSRYLRSYDLPMRDLRGMWYTMMAAPMPIQEQGASLIERSDEDEGTSTDRDNNVDLAESMSQTLQRIRKTMAEKLPLIHSYPQSPTSEGIALDTPLAQTNKAKSKRKPWLSNTALLYLSRQIHDEFAEIIYPNSIFAFGSPRLAERFASHTYRHRRTSNNDGSDKALHNAQYLPKALPVSRLNLANIRYICLEARAEGRSTSIGTLHMQNRYYLSWMRACTAIARTMNSLTDISIFVEIPYGGPYKLSLDAVWAQPWFALAESTSLTRAAVYVCAPPKEHFTTEPFFEAARTAGWTWELDERTLEVFAEMIRRCILGWDREDAVREMMRRCRVCWPESEESWRVLEGWNRVIEYEADVL